MAETVRTFVAIEMPPEVREFLARCQDRLKRSGADARWVRTELIHLTLVFLGEVPVDMLGDLEKAVRSAVAGHGAMALRVAGLGRFPPRGVPRVVWAGVEDATGSLPGLRKAVAEATAAFAEKTEDRPYQAHLTLGRVRGPKNARSLAEVLDSMVGEAGTEFEAKEVVVFKSVLGPGGPQYTALARVTLGASGGG
jgi:2'-5' RNA ligase